MSVFISAQELFTGTQWLSEVLLEVKNGTIVSIKKDGYDHKNSFPIVTPALIDLQIYGADGFLFSEFPESKTIEKIHQHCLTGGTVYFQPTIASQSTDIIYKAIDAVKEYITSGGKGCIGLHIEGPWINIEKRGAHDESYLHAPSIKEAVELLEHGKGWISMITLAPEVCHPDIIQLFKDNGIVVSIGHSNANYETATQFLNEGLVGTHLFNAMSSFGHRNPGVVGAFLNHKTAKCSIIPDGHHVDFVAIKIAKKIMGERLFCITDAVTNTLSGKYQHQLVGDKYENNGTLSGSSLTQLKSVNNLIEKVGIDLGEAICMCSTYPAQVMKKENISGTIEVNKKGDLLCLSTDLHLMKVLLS